MSPEPARAYFAVYSSIVTESRHDRAGRGGQTFDVRNLIGVAFWRYDRWWCDSLPEKLGIAVEHSSLDELTDAVMGAAAKMEMQVVIIMVAPRPDHRFGPLWAPGLPA